MKALTLVLALVASLLFASSAKSCPPVAVQSYGVQVQSGCFAPSVAVQAYAVPQAVVVQQAYPAVAVQAFAVPAAVNVKVNARPRIFSRVFGPRVNVRVRGF